MNLDQVDYNINKLELQLKSLREKRKEAIGRKYLKCNKCDSRQQIRNTTFLQDKHYIAPHGCTGGDYWIDGDGFYDCHNCGKRLSLSNKIEKGYKYSFREVVEFEAGK